VDSELVFIMVGAIGTLGFAVSRFTRAAGSLREHRDEVSEVLSEKREIQRLTARETESRKPESGSSDV